jgi:hypothetical protein
MSARSNPWWRASLAVVAGTLVLSLGLLTGVAQAGRYHVYSCRTPSGQVAPTDGWSGTIGGTFDSTLETCPSQGGLVAALYSGIAHPADTDLTTWAFNAPAGEVLYAATLWRAGDTLGGKNEDGYYTFWLTGVANTGTSTQVFDSCSAALCLGEGNLAEPLAADNRIGVAGSALHSPYLSLNASCGSLIPDSNCPAGPGDSRGYAAVVELFAADLVLEQSAPPSVSNVVGNLSEAPVLSGMSDVAFDVTDPGSGVYEAVFDIDGQPVDQRVLADNEGRCRDVGQTTDGLPAFLYTQPCPASLSADVPFDTTGIANGTHRLLVTVLDAAGNATTVLEREVAVANAGPSPAVGRGAANGTNPSDGATLTAAWHGTSSAHLTGAYGKALTLGGRLTNPSGQGIADAGVEVSETPSSQGAHPRMLASPRTDANGYWSMRLARDTSSCVLRFAYRSHVNDPAPAATRTLKLDVRPRIVLSISPRVTSVGHSIRFSGQVAGGSIPRGGKQLVLEASSGGGSWVEFHVIRTDARGRFRSSYRFHYPGPVNYRFRAVSRYEADFPFLAGDSNVVDVRER